MNVKEKAERPVDAAARIINKLRGNVVPWQKGNLEIAVEIRMALEDAYAEGFKAAREKAAGAAKEDTEGHKRLCSLKFDGHDDRWCNVCEDMRDEAYLLEQRIRQMEDK